MLLPIDRGFRVARSGSRDGAAGLSMLLSRRAIADATRIVSAAWRCDRALVALAAALAAAYLIFFALYYVHGLAYVAHWASETLRDDRFGYLHPGSYSKSFSFGEAGAAVILLAAAYARWREPVYAAAAIALFAVLLDMTIGVHRHISWTIVRALDLASLGGTGSVGPLGESVGIVVGGVAVAAVLVAGSARSRPGHAHVGLILLAAIIVLGAVAAGFELFLSLAIATNGPAYLPIKLTEEIGQMVILGVITVVAATLAVHGDRLGTPGRRAAS